MKLIPLTQGKFAQVDDSDFEFLSHFKWHAKKDGKRFYAQRNVKTGDSWIQEQMHCVLLPGVLVDHWDGDGLNNQRHNLRACGKDQNAVNSQKRTGTLSLFKGVTWRKQSQKWQAQMKHGGRTHYLGLFTREEDAARAYDAEAQRRFGEFARPNFT